MKMRYEIKNKTILSSQGYFVQNRFRPVTSIVIQGRYRNITTLLLLIPHQENSTNKQKRKRTRKNTVKNIPNERGNDYVRQNNTTRCSHMQN